MSLTVPPFEPLTDPASPWPLALRIAGLDDPEALERFCQANAPYRIERSAAGEILVMPPVFSDSSRRNARLVFQLMSWAIHHEGEVYDSSGGFRFADGSLRSPDAAWVRRSRLEALSEEERQGFLPLSPDFVAELRSRTDRLADLKAKMEAYVAAGVGLGLLIDPLQRKAHVYRPGQPALVLEDPTTIDCSPELPGCVLETGPLFS